jgi:hypothetical protein
MDKHIDTYKKQGGAEALMGHVDGVSNKVARIHGLTRASAKKFVNDYIDSKLNESTDELTEWFPTAVIPHQDGDRTPEQKKKDARDSKLLNAYRAHGLGAAAGLKRLKKYTTKRAASKDAEVNESILGAAALVGGIAIGAKINDYLAARKKKKQEEKKIDEAAISSAVKLKMLAKQLIDSGYEHTHSSIAGKHSGQYYKHPKTGDRKVIRWGKINDLNESVELNEGVSEISKGYYEYANGKRPSGKGYGWMFSTVHPAKHSWDKHKDQTYQHSGEATFSEASKAAVKHFKDKGHQGDIHVLS